MKYRICKRCVMDTTDSTITFDKKGYCNHCNDALKIKDTSIIEGEEGIKKWNAMIEELKQSGKGKKYDCIIGISGGIDSSYLAYRLSKEGLRILGIHIDGGWNTKESNKNIEIIKEKCNIDLEIIKINEEEMMDLQRAYFLAEVPNLDVPQDHAFFAKLYKYMEKHNIKYFISGHNWASESITPIAWGFDAYDSDNIKDIHKKYGKIKLKEYPILSFFENKIAIPYIYKIKKIRPLDWINYNPITAKEILIKEIGFIDYGSKHCESVFTRLLQTYIQPKKFGYDKRRAHLSSMIVSELITREEALKILDNSDVDKKRIEKDIEIFINKINISRKEFDSIINSKNINNHDMFKTYKQKNQIFNKLRSILNKLKSIFFKKFKIIFVITICLLIVVSLFGIKYYRSSKKYYNMKRNCVQVYDRFDFIDLIDIVDEYDPTKQWYEFQIDTHTPAVTGTRLDENGIALNVRDGKAHYNPVSIAQYGLNTFGFYIVENNEDYLKEAILQADYLVNAQNKETGDFYYDFDYFAYGTTETLKTPWSSAMAIGNVLSLYSRIYSITNDEKYIKSGDLALQPLTKTVEEGGLVSYFNNYKFYEEYPTTKGNYTLNGFMFTLIGLYDYYNVTGNELAKELYDDGIKTLKYMLPYYDSAGISLYHLAHLFYPNQEAYYNRKYHVIHIAQLELLYNIEKEEVFKHYMDLWKSYTVIAE